MAFIVRSLFLALTGWFSGYNKKLIGDFKSLKFVVVTLLFLIIGINNATGAARTASVSGNWNSTTTWGGAAVPTSADDVTVNDNINVTVDIAASCNSLTISGGANITSVLISGTNTLTVTNGISIGAGTGTGDNKFVGVDAGTLTCASITMATTSNNNRDSYIRISTGTATVSGNITMNGNTNRNQLVITGTGTLNVGGTITGGTITSVSGGYTALTSGTVNYNSNNAQTIGDYIYYNLTLSGGGSKTENAATVNAVLSMEGTATISAPPTYGGNATLQYKGSNSRTAGVEFTNNFAGSGGLIIDQGAANTITLNANKTALTSINIKSGTLDLSTYTINRPSAGGIFTIASNASLIIRGTNSFPGNYSTHSIDATSTVQYAGANQTVANLNSLQTYGNLVLTGSGTKTLPATFSTINGNFTIDNCTTTAQSALTIGGNVVLNNGYNITWGAFTHNVSGNWTRNGYGSSTFTGSTINFTGATAATILDINNSSFNNIAVSKSTNSLTLSGNLTLTGNLNINSTATLNAAGYNLTVGGTTSITGTLTAGAGTNTFTQDVTINSGGIWNESAAGTYAFAGSLTNNGTTFTSSTGTHTFSGSSNTFSGSNTTSIQSLTLTGSYTNSGTLTVGTTFGGSGNLVNTGTLNMGGTAWGINLTATANGNTVNYTGASGQTLRPVTYFNLGLSGGGTKTFPSAIIVNNNISIASGTSSNLGSNIVHTANALYLNGVVQASSTYGSSTSSAINTNNTYFTNTGIINTSNTWTGATNTDWGTETNWSKGIIPTSSDAALIPNVTNKPVIGSSAVCSALTVLGSSSVTINGSNTLTVSGNIVNGGTITCNSGTIFLTGSFTNTGTFNSNTGNVNYNGAAQTVAGVNYYHLTLSGSGSKTLQTSTTSVGGNLTLSGTASTTIPVNIAIAGDLVLGGGTTLNDGGYTASIAGNWTNNGGTLTSTGAIKMTGSNKTLGGTSSTAFKNLTIENSGFVMLGIGQTLSGTLALNNSILKLGAYNFTLGSTATNSGWGFSNSAMVVADGTGELRRTYTGTGSFTFPVGDNTDGTAIYSPVTINVTAGSFSGAYIGVRVTDTKHPQNTNTINYLTRYWTISQSGITGMLANVVGTYNTQDIVGTESAQKAYEYTSSAWTAFSTLGSNTLTANSVNTFGDFTGFSVDLPTITTGTISSSLCAGSPVSVSYTITGTFNAGNIFTAQLSNASGSFASPVTIGTLASLVAGTITATIPAGTIAGTGYRIRVISSNPVVTGTDNGIDLSIYAIPGAPTTTGGLICIGTTSAVTLSASGAIAGQKYNWYSAANGVIPIKTSLDNIDNTYTTPLIGLTTSYWVSILSPGGCEGTRTQVTATYPFVSLDDQNAAGANTWVGHVYEGMNQAVAYNGSFTNYYGHYVEPEIFNENFGGDTNCFSITSNSVTQSIYTETFSVRYRMNSTRKGLFVVDLGSDDGSRLTVDGNLIYNNWTDQAFVSRPSVLMNLTGSSSLVYEFYENGGQNQVVFQNITPVLANTLTTNTSQSISVGNSGTAISGDVLGTLPTGISLSGTGYQWTYSTTLGGARTNITGATGATYIPNASVAPFNTPGTYYIYRNVVLSSANNVSPNPYVATSESNVSTLVVNLPLITTSIASLTGFSYNLGGGPSAQQSFTVSGAYLGSNLVITPPTNYEISLTTGGAFVATNPISLPPTSGTVSTTTIYVRLKAGLAAGNYNAQNIACTSNSAVTKNVSCSGTVNTPVITASLTTLTGFSYIIGYGPSPQQSFTVSGANLITDLTVTPSTNYEISITSNSGFQSTPITLTQSGSSVSTTTIYVRLKAGLSAANYNSENIVTTSTNAASKSVTCSGTVYSPTITTTPTSLTSFTYPVGYGPSAVDSFTVSGSNLVANIAITPSSNFEISTVKSPFAASGLITLTVSGGSVSTTKIYVRMKAGHALGVVSAENITSSSTGAINSNVSCSGSVVNAPKLTTSVISGTFSYTFGSGPSAQQSFTVSGDSLLADVIITPPSDYEISISSGSGFVSTPITLNRVYNSTTRIYSLASTAIYVRLKNGLGTGTYSENVVASSVSAVSKNVALSGNINASATLTTIPSYLGAFSYTLGSGPSGVQSFIVTGTNLSGNVTVTPPTNFEISTTSGSGFTTAAIPLTQLNGNVTATIYARLASGLALGSYGTSNVSLTSSGAVVKTVGLYGEVLAANAPKILTSKDVVSGFGYMQGTGPSSVQSLTLSGASLTSQNLTVALSDTTSYQISQFPTSGFKTSSIILAGTTVASTPSTYKINPTIIYIRLKAGNLAGKYRKIITLSSGTISKTDSLIGMVFVSPLITAGGGGSYCAGSIINLTSVGADIQNRYWQGPNTFYSTDQNPVISNATTAMSGTYTVTGNVLVGGNLIYNGDFEAGNTGFGSSYGYVVPSAAALQPESKYTVVKLPSSVHSDFTNYPDHTTGTGYQMVVNGAPTPGVVVWTQSVPVIPGATYQFSYSEQTVNITQVPKNASQLQLYVNGVAAGPVYTAPQVNYQWATFIYNAAAGSNTVLNLELINQNIVATGNDFALDDIIFQQILPATSSTDVTVNPILPVGVTISASPGTSVYSNSPVTFTANPTNGGLTPTYQWQVNGGAIVGTNSTYTYVPKNGDIVKCTLNSSLSPCVTNNPASATVVMTVTTRINFWYGYIDTDWAKTGNWTANYVPLTGDDVEYATVANFGSTAIKDLWLDQNRTIGSLINATTKRVVIPPAKGLSVNNAVSTDGNPDRVYLQSSTTNSNGSLVFTQPNLNQSVKATVEMQALGQYNATGYTFNSNIYHYTWQYFGVPMSSVLVDTVFAGSYVRQYDESKTVQYGKWTQLSNGAVLTPFKGYELTQKTPKTIIFKGQLVNSSVTIPLNYTVGAYSPGQNILSNPYSGAISIKQLIFDTNTEQTVYLYNTGTFGQWGISGAGSINGNTTTPGQYQSIPINYAGDPGIPADVPSMQGFLVKTLTSANGSLTIPYSSVIINNIHPQRAPNVNFPSDKTFLLITLKGTYSNDNLWLYKAPGTSHEFDNGWDGYKILALANVPQIFAMENSGNFQINSTDDINNTIIGLVSGSDLQDTLIFKNQNLKSHYQGIYLTDLVENKTIDITTDGTSYIFNPGSTNEPTKRFKITTSYYEPSAPDAKTNLKLFSSKGTIFVQNLSNLSGDFMIFDIAGRYLKKGSIGPYGIVTVSGIIPGAYIAKAITANEDVSKRLIVQ